MSKNIDSMVEEMRGDEVLRKSMRKLSTNLDEKYRAILEATYLDKELRSLYEALRTHNTIKRAGKDTAIGREVLRFPNQFVYNFLNDIFKPIYGEKWVTDKKTLKGVCMKHPELICPWMLVDPTRL